MRRLADKMRRCPLVARALAASLVLVFVAGQVGSFVHLVTVRHERCLEHGELVDVHTPVSSTAILVVPGPGQHLAGAPADDREHRHEHCALAPHRQQRVTVTLAHSSFAAPPRVHAPPLAAASPAVVVGDDVYRLAPKTSPPA